MKVIILAGGFGTRLSEYTYDVPKPMVNIGSLPILWHLMKIYAFYNHKEFYIALGYKSEIIKEYFLNYKTLNSDFSVDLSSGEVCILKDDQIEDWKVNLIDTGTNSMTGGRVKRLQSLIGNETCLITYGDGLSDINLDELTAFHKQHGKEVTITAVRPTARFGELEIDKDIVKIKKISMRTSVAINRDDITTILPNSLITTNKVINWSHQTKETRFRINVGVAYGSDVDLVVSILKESASEYLSLIHI